jgi:hypothetical protein
MCCVSKLKTICDKACQRRVRVPSKGQALFMEDPRNGKRCPMHMSKEPKHPVVIESKQGNYFVLFGEKDGNARLLRPDGTLMPDAECPSMKLTFKVVKQLVAKSFNNHWYFGTKVGVFSMTTGKRIKHTKIIALCGEEGK